MTKIGIAGKKMKNNNQKKAVLARLNKMKYYVRRFGFLDGSCKVLLPTITAVALNISNIQAQEKQDRTDDPVREIPQMPARGLSDDDFPLLAYESKVVYDIDAEVTKRADWFISRFLEAAKTHLDNIMSCGNKQAYVKENFFDVVSPVRKLPGSTPYCITALNRALIDANDIGGDLTGVLPNPNSQECYAANECNAFAAFLRQKGFGDCIDNGTIDFSKLEPGDIILTPRDRKGNKHARQYLGQKGGVHYALNFNIDGIREFKNTSAVIIHMKKLTRKAILCNLEKARLISSRNGPFDTILPMDQARKIQNFLSRGRNNRNYEDTQSRYLASASAFPKRQPENVQKSSRSTPDVTAAPKQPSMAAIRRRDEHTADV